MENRHLMAAGKPHSEKEIGRGQVLLIFSVARLVGLSL
jgi:hypothetical protein